MTTVIAIEDRTGVKIAADSRVTSWHTNDGWVQKIVQNGPFTFAAAGYLRAIQVLEFAKLPQPPEKASADALDRFVSLELVPAITAAFKEVDSDKDAKEGSVFIAIVGARVYQIYGADGSWTRSSRGFYAIGSGGDYALGALEAGSTPEKAVQIASLYDPNTNDRVTVMEVAA